MDLLIEIWSDVVCPWCYIGKRNLESALADFEGRDKVEIRHRAFQLDPSVKSTRPTIEALGEKYGHAQVSSMLERVTKVAADAGLAFKLEHTLSGNTLDAHRLLLWAQSQGDAQPLLAAMYRSHFEQADSIFGNEQLLAIALEAGFDKGEVEKVLAGDAYASDVEADQAKAASLGANGVPFFVVDGKYGISGAQPISTFSDVLVKASS